MNTARVIATLSVSAEMQKRFTDFTGDRNPMHTDAIAARRTQAGAPVVHGMHTLLWALETLVGKGLITKPLCRLKVKFPRWLFLDNKAELIVLPGAESDLDLNPVKFHVAVHGQPVLVAELYYSDTGLRRPEEPESRLSPRHNPIELSFAELEGRRGQAYAPPSRAASGMFPELSRLLQTRCVAELAACSYIVGMEAPGLHSSFSKLDIAIQSGTVCQGLAYEVSYRDERFRKIRIAVQGSTLKGTLEAFLRTPPVSQATIAEVAVQVKPNEFAGMRALVLGGSRGLGEVTAKIVAAGSGEVAISYVVGKDDAERVAAEICEWGGNATTLQYDVRQDPAPQLAALRGAPTHLFYFATNPIFRQRSEIFSWTAFTEFSDIYVKGFYDLCLALMAARGTPEELMVFYPSSIAIEERPAGITEYAMAKAAGEQLCADMNRYLPGLHITLSRLCRLPTDQTASVLPEGHLDPITELLPLVRSMMRFPVETLET